MPSPLLLLLSACAFSAVTAVSQQNPASGFIIAGIVEQHGSHQPLRRAEVSISPVEHRDHILSCLTTNDGGFKFTSLPAGKYSLQAQAHNLVQGYRGDGEYSTGIVVGPGIDSEHITFVFDPPATISGNVLDEEGEPVRNAQVVLLQRGIFSGRPQIAMAGQTGSGSSGDFRFRALKRGTYFVAVSARPWYAQETPSPQGSNASEFDVAYPITYYPEALDPEAASPITLSEGGVSNIQILLRPVPALRVVVNASSNEATSLDVSAAGPEGLQIPMNTPRIGGADRQEIPGLAPGRYVLSVERFRQGSDPTVARKALDLAANSTLDLSDFRPIDISGQLQIEGGEVPGDEPAVSLVSSQQSQAVGYTRVGANGSFHISSGGISPGKYQIRLVNTRELYIKSVASTGAAYSRGILDVLEGASIQLCIVAARGVSDVNGIALKDGKPFAGAMILLLPQDAGSGTDIPRDQSDSDGSFTLKSVPPGRYTLIAIDDGRDLAYALPSLIQPYLARGQSIEIPVPNGVTVKVNIQPRLR